MKELGKTAWRKVWVAPLLGWLLTYQTDLPAEEAKNANAATRDYAVAVGLENKQLYPQAAARWQKFIDSYRGDERLDRAHYHLATCQLQAGEAEKAGAGYRQLLAMFPSFKDRDAAQFNLAMALYQLAVRSQKPEGWKIAAEAFAQVPAAYTQSKHVPAALYYQAEALFAAGQGQQATALYEKLIAGYPNHNMVADARFALGAAQQELGQDAAAGATFRTFIDAHGKDPRVPETKLRLGMTLLAANKYAEAMPPLQQAADTANFELADLALLRLAQCLAEQKQNDQAVERYKSLPGKFPKSKYAGAARVAAGKLLYAAEKYPQSQEVLAQAIAAADDSSPEAAYWQSKTLLKLKQIPQALAEIERAIQAYPKSKFLPALVLGRIDVLYEIPERRKETVALYQQFAAQHPDDELAPQASYMGALAALSMGEYADADRQAAAFLQNPKYQSQPLVPEVMFVAAESLLLVGGAADPVPQVAKAESLYREIVDKFPQHRHVAACRLRTGLCLYLQKKYDPAIAYLSQSLGQLTDPALQAEAHLLIGRAHQDAKRMPQAVAAFRESLRVKPDWPRADEVLLALAGSLREDKKLDEAMVELNRLATMLPGSKHRANALAQLGEIDERQTKYDEAIRHFEQVLNEYSASPLAPTAAYGIARAKLAKDDFAGTVASATLVTDRFAASEVVPRARYLRGLARQRLKDFSPAVSDLEAFVASTPAADEAHDARFTIALCQMGLKQYGPAAATLKALVDAAPKYARADEAYYELGFALAEAKQDQAAAEAWRSLATRYPKSDLAADAWFRVGQYHEAKKEWDPARDAYQHARKQAKTPDVQEKLQFKLGWVQYQAEHFPQAAAAFQAQMQAFPAGPLLADATYLAGDALYRKKQFAPALDRFKQAITQRNEKYLARALYRAGDCAAQLKQWPASAELYQTLVNQFPKFELVSEARYGLGWAQQNQNKLSEARQTYEQVTEETETETAAKARFMIGECAFREKKYGEAVEHYLTAALGYAYEEWQVLGYLEAGRCFLELKDNTKARDMFETVLKKYPNHPKAKDAARLLASIKTIK